MPAEHISTTSGLPAHLRDDAPYIRCNKCGRKSWGGSKINGICGMLQPNGDTCDGVIQPEQSGIDMPVKHISTTTPAAAEAADRNGEVCALVSDIPMRYRRMEFNAQLQNEVNSLQLELAAERNKSESLRAQLHGMQDGSLLRDTQAALSAERKRADAAEADARRFGWVLPILSGDESGIADARAFKLALGISKGLTARAIIDEDMK